MSKFGPEVVADDWMFSGVDGEILEKADLYPGDLDSVEEEGLQQAMSNGHIDEAETEAQVPLSDSEDNLPNRRYFLRDKPGRNGWTKLPHRHNRYEKSQSKPRREKLAGEHYAPQRLSGPRTRLDRGIPSVSQIAQDLEMNRRTVSILVGRILDLRI